MTTSQTQLGTPWPFPPARHSRSGAYAAGKLGDKEDDDHQADAVPHLDPVEQELVEEQLERDPKASKAVDSKIRE